MGSVWDVVGPRGDGLRGMRYELRLETGAGTVTESLFKFSKSGVHFVNNVGKKCCLQLKNVITTVHKVTRRLLCLLREWFSVALDDRFHLQTSK